MFFFQVISLFFLFHFQLFHGFKKLQLVALALAGG